MTENDYKRLSGFEKWWEKNNELLTGFNTRKDLAKFVWDNKPAKTSAEFDNNYAEDFEVFWKEYPKKTGKSEAYSVWKVLKKNEDPFHYIIASLKWQVNTDQWKSDGGKYIPNPATYLRNRRWEDEAPSCVAQAEQAKERYLDFNGIWRERCMN